MFEGGSGIRLVSKVKRRRESYNSSGGAGPGANIHEEEEESHVTVDDEQSRLFAASYSTPSTPQDGFKWQLMEVVSP